MINLSFGNTHIVDIRIEGKHRTAVPKVVNPQDNNKLTFNPVVT